MRIALPDASGNTGGGKAKALVVEANAEMRALLRDVLPAEGYDTCEAADDAQALLALRGTRVDAVLDKSLPGLSGFEILPGIRCLYPEVPVVLVSAYGDSGTEVRARERGATAFLPKPFRMADLLRLIRRHLPSGGTEA